MLEHYQRLVDADPNNVAALVNLGKLKLDAGLVDAAIALLERAVDLHPDIFLAVNYLADAYCTALQPAIAIHFYEKALALRPHDPDVLTNLSVCHWQLAEYTIAHAYSQRVREQHPVNYGLMSLLMGDYAEGWKYWEHLNTAKRLDGLPQWEGEPIHDQRVLVLDEEQGYGDTIMMARFVPLLTAQCKTLTFQTRRPLTRLMRASFPEVEVIEEIGDPTRFDKQVRLFSLPRLLQITGSTIPAHPYLRATEQDCAAWRDRLSQCQGLKVGLRWNGSPDNPMDRIRSITDPTVLNCLRDVPNVSYVSLSKEVAAMPDLPILDVSAELNDFADTAALMHNLDLVISVDTGVLNLAGAIGAKTWLMNYHGTDWRWGASGDRSPWYPSIEIIRQPRMGDWGSVIEQIRVHLTAP